MGAGLLKATIDALPPWSVLIHGGATGPDAWAQEAIDARRYESGHLLYAHAVEPISTYPQKVS